MRQKWCEPRLELFSLLVHPAQGQSMSSLPGCMSLAAAPAAADSAEIAELQQAAELETWVLQKESEVAYVDRLFDDASR